ncbi:MAG: IS3 family transposase [Acidobacteriota bacterium]
MVEQLRQEGHSVSFLCETFGISRSGYYSRRKKKGGKANKPARKDDKALLVLTRKICEAHPFWGYRRVRAWLKHREGITVNCKKVYRIMRENGLTVKRTIHKAKRTPQRSKPRATRPRQFWGIDMTKFLINTLGWVYLVLVLDWYTKKIVGWKVSLRSRSQEWREALEMGISREFPQGVRGADLKLISDNGSQPTSTSFMKDMKTLEIEQIFTSYDNPKGNSDTERVIRTMKEELLWLNEFSSLEEAREKIESWIGMDYNQLYVHSTLEYLSPMEFEEKYNQEILKQAA